jgi:hypothetical protein
MTTAAIPPPPQLGPPAVSRFEYNLLTILRFVLGQVPAEQAMPLMKARASRPACLSRTAVELVQDTLAKGCVLFLVRSGGWRRERFLRAGQPTAGRVWDRVPEAERSLDFSRHALEFLIGLTADVPGGNNDTWDALTDELTPGDELLFYLAYEALTRDADTAAALQRKAAFRENRLAWLTHPGDFAGPDEPTPPRFDPLFEKQWAAILECLQPYLTVHWIRAERQKGLAADWKAMRLRGRAEFAALSAFLAAAERAGRYDLARFVLRANAELLSAGDPAVTDWTGGLAGNAPARLADRLETQRAALAFVRTAETLAGWEQQARSIGYFDDGYAAAQLWKADWEAANGDEVVARARRLLRQLEPLNISPA